MYGISIHYYAMLGEKGKVEKSMHGNIIVYIHKNNSSSVPGKIPGNFKIQYFEYSSIVEHRTQELQTQLKLFFIIILLVVVLI